MTKNEAAAAEIAAGGFRVTQFTDLHYRFFSSDGHAVDYWPSTKRWWRVNSGTKGRGVESLIAELRSTAAIRPKKRLRRVPKEKRLPEKIAPIHTRHRTGGAIDTENESAPF